MSTYTKHITHLSTNNQWELSFDVTATTPEEIISMTDCYSTITLSNGVITYRGTNTYIMPSSQTQDTLYINNIRIDRFTGSGGVPTSLSYGDILGIGNLNSPPGNIRKVVDMVVNHNDNGIGVVNVLQTIDIYNKVGVSATIVDTITFDFDFYLNTIIIAGKGSTEMGPDVRQAILNGLVAIKTRILFDQEPSATTLTVDDTSNVANSEKIVLTESDAIKTWELNDERYVPDNGFVGQFVARTLTGELHNISDDFTIENKDIELQIGVVQLGTRYQWLTTEDGKILTDEFGNRVYIKDLGLDNTTWYSLGNFLVTKPEDDEVADNTRFEAFDYATKFNKDFNADYADNTYTSSFNTLLQSNSSVSAMWLAKYVCAQVGIEFGNTTFTNSDFEITSNQLVSGESCRDVMKYISELAFGWCRIGWDNKCYIDEPTAIALSNDDTNILTNDNYYSLTTQKQTFGPINRVVVGMSAVDGEDVSDEDIVSIEENGLTEITIMDNPFLYTADLRNDFVEKSGRTLFGLTYTPLETETPGHPWLTGKELIDVKDMEDNDRYTYPFNRTINYTGHIKTKLVTPAPTEQEKTVAYNKTVYKTLRNVGIKVDKQEGTITAINSRVEAAEKGLGALETRVETEMTDTYTRTQIQEIISGTAEDGTAVSSVTTTAGTFDKNGLTIEQTNSATKTNINSNGMIISNTSGAGTGDELLNVNSDGVDAKNIKVRKYLNIGSHSRLEDYEDGTGVFYIGGVY